MNLRTAAIAHLAQSLAVAYYVRGSTATWYGVLRTRYRRQLRNRHIAISRKFVLQFFENNSSEFVGSHIRWNGVIVSRQKLGRFLRNRDQAVREWLQCERSSLSVLSR